MINIQKQVEYWRNSGVEDWQVAIELIYSGRLRHGLFFVALALEKILKALVCFQTNDLAPRIHNLVRLSEIADLNVSPQQLDILAETSIFSIEGRYPDSNLPSLSREEALIYLKRAEELYQWLMSQSS